MNEANGPLTTRHANMRVAFVGSQGSQWLGHPVDSVVLDPDDLAAGLEFVEGKAQVAVVDHDPGRAWAGRLKPILEKARGLDVPIIGILGTGQPAWKGYEALRISSRPASGSVVVGPAIDPKTHRPRALKRIAATNGTLAVDRPPRVGLDKLRQLLAPWLPRAGSIVLPWVPEPGIDRGLPLGDGSGPEIEAVPGSIVLVTGDGHTSSWSRATHIAEISAIGLPVIAASGGADDLQGLIPDDVVASLATPLRSLQEPEARERLAVAQRRSVFREMSSWSRWDHLRGAIGLPCPPLPSVSILLSTRRRHFLAHAISQIGRQTYPNIDCVLILHGDAWPSALPELEACNIPLTVVRVPGTASFGDALNEGFWAAKGDFISKMDDDDWYGADHIWDLMLAYEHGESQIVGKAAEWLYLADPDITVRRIADGAEWPSTTIAGGTLLLLRDDLRRVGGWRSVNQAVDQALIADILTAGGGAFRTHGYGYVLHRHTQGHTWVIDLDYLLRDTPVQFRGLRLDAAMAGEPQVDQPVDAAWT